MKGSLALNTRAFVESAFGPEGWEAVKDQLTPADRAEVETIAGVAWFSEVTYARLVRAVDDALGAGDLALAVRLGRFQAERDLTTVHRFFLRLIGPAMSVEKLVELWPRYHDTGSWMTVRPRDGVVVGTIAGWTGCDHAICRATVGFIGRSLELLGAKRSMVEHVRCAGLGDPECSFNVRWGARVADRTDAPPAAVAAPGRVSGMIDATSPHEAFAASVEALEGADTGRRARARSRA